MPSHKNRPRPAGTATRPKKPGSPNRSNSWDEVADWYAGWSGPEGSRHHRELAIPTLVELMRLKAGDRVLDIACGAGALVKAVRGAKASYVGIDLSPKLIGYARKHHKRDASFYVGDATNLAATKELSAASFDVAAYLLSIQDINPLEDTLASAAWALKPNARLAILMTHPCFRIPRQSGWGRDEGRQLIYRRVDRYLTRLDVPMQEYAGNKAGVTRSFHRPLQDYFENLYRAGFLVERIKEVCALPPPGQERKAERLAREDIPLFLGLSAVMRS